MFDLRQRVRVHLLTYEVFSVKRCVCMQILTHESMTVCNFEHNFQFVYPMRSVSTKLYQLRHATTCKFSLKRHVSAPFWLRRACPCPGFWHTWTCPSGNFPLFWPLDRTMRRVHCKLTYLYATFRLTKTHVYVQRCLSIDDRGGGAPPLRSFPSLLG